MMISSSSVLLLSISSSLFLLFLQIHSSAASPAEHSDSQSIVEPFIAPIHSECAQLAGSDEERLLLCQLYESSALLAQLGALVNEGIARLAASQGMARVAAAADGVRDKRKHEYIRFGKRKHEYLRFGRK